MDDKAENEAVIGLRVAREKLQHAATANRFYKTGDNVRDREQPNSNIHPRTEEGKDMKSVWCAGTTGKMGALNKRHRRRRSPSNLSIGSGRFRKKSSAEEVSPRGKNERSGKSRK